MKLYIIAGANGSGKTTFAKSFNEELAYNMKLYSKRDNYE